MNEHALPFEQSPPAAADKKAVNRENRHVAAHFSSRILKKQVLDAEEQAREILRDAQAKAAALVAAAEARAEVVRAAAFQTGREEASRELLENLLATRQQRSQALVAVEQDVLRLAVKIAAKIIGREIRLDQNVRAEIVFTALRQLRQQEILTVRINVNDLPLVEKMRGEMAGDLRRVELLDFVVDFSVREGGCLIESSTGVTDAKLETQLRVFERALLDHFNSESH